MSYVSYPMLCSTVFLSATCHVLLICTGQGKYLRDVSSLNYHVFEVSEFIRALPGEGAMQTHQTLV